MLDSLDSAHVTFAHTAFAIAIGAAVMVLAALVAERLTGRVAMRRTLWQAVFLGLGLLLSLELTGMTHAVAELARIQPEAASRIPDKANPAELPKSQPDLKLLAPRVESSFVPTDTRRDFAIGESFLPAGSGERDRAWPEFPDDVPSFLAEDLSTLPPMTPANTILETEELSPSPDHSTAPILAASLEESLRPAAQPASSHSDGRIFAHTLRFIALAWAVGTCIFLGRTVKAHLSLHRARRRWHTIDVPEFADFIDGLRQRFGFKRAVRIAQVNGLPGPVALGTLQPTVLVPGDFSKRFSQSQQQVILAHELAHLAANDPAWLLFAEVTTALFWWHPLVHFGRHRFRAASEQAADEASLLVPNGPDILADCLVKLGRRLSGRPRFGWVAAEGSGLRSGLARRVQRLWKLSDSSVTLHARRVPVAIKPAAVALLLALTFSCTLWAYPKASFAKGEQSMNVLTKSWRQSLAAAALTALLAPLAVDADDVPAPPKPPQVEEGSPIDDLLVADRGEREGRERGDRERREREARGDRERGPRERDVEHRDRPERDRDVPRERPEAEREELHRRAAELEREKAEFEEQAGNRARELEEAMRNTQREREEITRHVAELEERLAGLKKEMKEEGNEELERQIDEHAKELERVQDARNELTERAEGLEREMVEHRENVERHMGELARQFAEVRDRLGRPEGPRDNPERAEIMRRIAEITRQIPELQRAGKPDEVARLHEELRGLHERLAPRDRDFPPPPGPREGMERLERMERELHALREAGRHEEAERVEAELRELQRRLGPPRDGDRPGPPPELQVRIDHLRVAMDNLHAAGLHDQAEQIAGQIERLTREFVPGPPEPRGPDARPRPEPGGEIVGQLRGEIEQLRRENEEMRRMMQEIRESQERLMNELRERR